MNDWTTTSPGYYKTVPVAVVRKYFNPSFFLDDRAVEEIGIGYLAGDVFSSREDHLWVSDYAPASLAHVTYNEEVLSLPLAIEAGWIDPTVRISERTTNHWTTTTLNDFVFDPNLDFKIKFLKDCFLMIVVPRHHFQASRARSDMIKAADKAGFIRVKMETFTELGNDGTGFFDLRSLCFDDGPNTGIGCLAQATEHKNPLNRYVIWYDPANGIGIGDWFKLDPNDID